MAKVREHMNGARFKVMIERFGKEACKPDASNDTA
jgi:hypothetical protein